MTTKQAHVKLKNLAKDSRANLYEMLRLADQILSDHEYVDELGGQDVAIEVLEADEFSMFAGWPGLPALLYAYQKVPHKQWKELRYNIGAVLDLSRSREPAEKKERIDWKKRAQEAEAKVAGLTETVAGLTAELESLTQDNANLSREVAELRGELRGLSRKVAAA